MKKRSLVLGICIFALLLPFNGLYIEPNENNQNIKIKNGLFLELNNSDNIFKVPLNDYDNITQPTKSEFILNYTKVTEPIVNNISEKSNLSGLLSEDEIEMYKNKISLDILLNGIPDYAYLDDEIVCLLVTFTHRLKNEEINDIFEKYGKMWPWGRNGYFSQPYSYSYSIINLNTNVISDFLKDKRVKKIENINRPHLLDSEIASLKEKNDIPINQGIYGMVTLATGDLMSSSEITIENISAIIYFINNETKNSYIAVSKDDGNFQIELPVGNYTIVTILYNNSKEIRMYRDHLFYTSPYYYIDNIDQEHYLAYFRELCLKNPKGHYGGVTLSYIHGKLFVTTFTQLKYDIYINRVTS
jgi:hypothetical protein